MDGKRILGIVIGALLVAGCERGPEKASPQSGPLVGEWKYLGNDIAEDGYVRAFVIGDSTWWVPMVVRFSPNGSLNNGRARQCNYWILSPSQLKLDCSAGQTTIAYSISDNKLMLDLRGPNALLNGGAPILNFERVDAAPSTTALPANLPANLMANCDLLAQAAMEIPGSKLTRSTGLFEDDIGGSPKEGCLIKINGSFKAIGKEPAPDSRIDLFAKSQGWPPDNSHSADGPDGTVFAFWTPTAWCLVTGRWDGGDDSDPTNVPGDEYELTIGCTPR